MPDLTTQTDIDDFMSSASYAAARTKLGLGTAATAETGDFATSAQGATADTALQPSDIGTLVLAPDGDASALTNIPNPFDQSLNVADSPTFAAFNGMTIFCGTANQFQLQRGTTFLLVGVGASVTSLTINGVPLGTAAASAATAFQASASTLTSWASVTRASGFDTFTATSSSANLKALLTDETGSGAVVFATSPTLVTPALGTPSAIVLTNATGTAASLTAGNVNATSNTTLTSLANLVTVGALAAGSIATGFGNITATGITNTPISGSTVSGTTFSFPGLTSANTATGIQTGGVFFDGGSFTTYVTTRSGNVEITTPALNLNEGAVFLSTPAANTLALRNSTNGQTLLVSRSYTDGSNYSQLKIDVTGGVIAFTADEAGTGVGTLTSFTFNKPVLASNIPIVDTGWTANADAGDKTKVIPIASSIVTIAAALDLVVAGAGTLLLATAEKCKALETVGVATKRPNA